MGTVVLTGANGSMGIHATERLLNVHPDLTLVLTVRDSSSTDPNTAHLRSVISKYPKSKAHIYQLDLSSLAEVRDFTNNITSNIDRGELPRLKAVVCTAMFWNLVNPAQLTIDGYDQTIQIDHIANVALVLRLLGHFAPQGGRIVLLSSINHIPGKSPTEKIPPMIPPDLDQMVHPKPDADHKGQGVELYSNAKLLLTTWGYALNDYLAGVSSFPLLGVLSLGSLLIIVET
jgi:NAD(P)-dependent dehydrogenase (short-subunit alcohol dehydrogenase family)